MTTFFRLSCPRAAAAAAVAAAVLFMLAPVAAAAFEVAVEADHVKPKAGEHPRLIVRGADQIAALKAAAGTAWGKGAVARTEQAIKLMDRASLIGRNREVVKEAGYKAAGHAALFMLTGDKAQAAAAAEVVEREVVSYPMKATLDVMDRASRLHGAVMAYDMAYAGWNDATRKTVRTFLVEEADALLEKVGGVEAFNARSEAPVVVIATAGLVHLAILGESEDAAVSERLIAAAEKAVLAFLDRAVSDQGFAVGGESVKQAAFASGVLPFAVALKQVTGRDLTGHPAVRSTLVPLVYQAVPGAGLPITGPATAAVDRAGLFAMATPMAHEAHRPAIAWLFKELGGEKSYDIVRPHHVAYALISGLGTIEPAPPGGEAWPHVIDDAKAGVALFRTGWQGADDLVVMLHDGQLRILGMGGRWASTPGPHAHIWSHSPGAGMIDNTFGFQVRMDKKTTVYKVQQTRKLVSFEQQGDEPIASALVTTAGRVERTRDSIEIEKKVNNKKVKESVPVPQGGSFEGRRIVGIDCSGESGAAAVVVIVDELNGAEQVQREWVQHLGFANKAEANGNKLTLKQGNVTMRATVLQPGDAAWAVTGNPPHANFANVSTHEPSVQVVLVIGKGELPAVQAGDKGLHGKVMVGKRSVQLVDGRIVFGK